jgi:hypothetical protein
VEAVVVNQRRLQAELLELVVVEAVVVNQRRL